MINKNFKWARKFKNYQNYTNYMDLYVSKWLYGSNVSHIHNTIQYGKVYITNIWTTTNYVSSVPIFIIMGVHLQYTDTHTHTSRRAGRQADWLACVSVCEWVRLSRSQSSVSHAKMLAAAAVAVVWRAACTECEILKRQQQQQQEVEREMGRR